MGNLHLVREIVVPKQEYEEPYLISFEYFDNAMSRACLDISFDQHFATSRDCVVVGAVQVVTCGELTSLERTGLRLGDKGVRLVDMVYYLVDAVYCLTFVGMMALSDNFATCITSTSSSNFVFFGDVILL